ncbi:MAG: hypothetical protein ABF747_02290 [Bifidobacterium sp.]|uniref:Phage protein n=1 Tax=Bifidobacterium fermentum TaxID=3059035 RepID=A0AB39UHG9_9BIFI
MAVNIEKLVIDHLNNDGTLGDYPASFSIPDERPQQFITVERVGGSDGLLFATPLLSVQVWDSSRWNASDAATRLVKPSLLNLVEHDEIGAVDLLSIINNPDPESKQSRYQLSIQVSVRA